MPYKVYILTCDDIGRNGQTNKPIENVKKILKVNDLCDLKNVRQNF